jgi:hypothetical protein
MKVNLSIKNINKTFKELENKLILEVDFNNKKVVDNFVKELRQVTPVDTGFARDSWETSKSKDGIDVSNTAEYIEYLNSGTSKQAPAYFIERTALKYGTPQGVIVETV